MNFKGIYKALDGTLSDNVRLLSGGGKAGWDNFAAFARRCDVGCVVLFSEKHEATVKFKGIAADPPVKGLLYLQVTVPASDLADCPLCKQFGVDSLPSLVFVSFVPLLGIAFVRFDCERARVCVNAVQGHHADHRVDRIATYRLEQQRVGLEVIRCGGSWRCQATGQGA